MSLEGCSLRWIPATPRSRKNQILMQKNNKKTSIQFSCKCPSTRGSSKIVVNLDWSEWHKDVCPSWGSQRARQTKATIVADREMSSAPRWIVQRRRVWPTPRAWRWLRFRPIVASGRTIDVQGAAGYAYIRPLGSLTWNVGESANPSRTGWRICSTCVI